VAQAIKKGTRVIGVDRSRLGTVLGKRYASGESIRSLAASTGRSYGFVHRLLREAGVELRRRGGATRSHPAPLGTGRGGATRGTGGRGGTGRVAAGRGAARGQHAPKAG
jgi:Helix-turn-helix domain